MHVMQTPVYLCCGNLSVPMHSLVQRNLCVQRTLTSLFMAYVSADTPCITCARKAAVCDAWHPVAAAE